MREKRTTIIAEAGVNHNGDINKAHELIKIASKAKADYVKFQTFIAETLVTKYSKKAEYQINNKNINETQFEMLKNLELTKENHLELIKYSKYKNIRFLSSPFDIDSIKMLHKLNIDLFKVPSGEITNLPYLRVMGALNRPIVLSTGMATIKEIKDAINILISSGQKKNSITVLHCNTSYPTDKKEVNLSAMISIKNALNVKVGFSDHTRGIEIAIAAAAMGANIIEKHFTYDSKADGPDHAASLEPAELKRMVASIRNVDMAIGSGNKVPSELEVKNKKIVRKSIVASKTIKAGELFTENNLTTKRPGLGKSPMLWDEIIGTKATKNYFPDDFIVD